MSGAYHGKLTIKGGPGSGHHGHAGRPGSVGGSVTGALAGVHIELRNGHKFAVRGSEWRPVVKGKAKLGGKWTDVSSLLNKPVAVFDEASALKFKSVSDVEAYGDEEWQSWTDSLHPGAEEAYQWYADSNFEVINEMLRHPEQNRELVEDRLLQDQISFMTDSALPLKSDTIVYRSFGGEMSKRIAVMKEGESFTDKSFVSTGMLDNWYGKKHTTMIRVPKGTKAAYLAGFTNRESLSELSGDENELLLMPGLTFRVAGDQSGFKVLEVVPRG